MGADEIVQIVLDAGGLVWLDGDKVRARLPESLRPLVSVIRECKPELIEVLERRPLMPPGVRLIRWERMDAPVQLSRCETVTSVDTFIRTTLIQVNARLHDKRFLAGCWSLSELLARLAAVRCHVTLDDRKAMLQ